MATPAAAPQRTAQHADPIAAAVAALGAGPLTEDLLVRHIHPLFSRVLARREIYLANHSLGRPPDRMADDIRDAIDLWYSDMDGAWSAWLAELSTFRASIAELIGLSRPDAVVPKTAAGQGLRAVLNALPKPSPHVIATRGEFDAIDFVLKVYSKRSRAHITWVEPDKAGCFHAHDIVRSIEAGKGSVDLVVISHVFFSTGQLLLGIDAIVKAAHAAGAMVLLDTYHSAGVLPVEFDTLGCDFAIGGSYKYTRGGPGAAWLAIHPRHLTDPGRPDSSPAHPRLITLDTGWFAKKDTFLYGRTDDPALSPGGDAWLENTPPVILAYHAKAGMDLTLGLGVHRLREYSLGQLAFLKEQLRQRHIPIRGFEPAGAFVLLPHHDAPALVSRLKAAGVNTDQRYGCVRLCPDILTTRDELVRAADRIAREL